MIVGQYVLGIKVPGRSNSVIFMISGRRMAVWKGETAGAQTLVKEGSSILGDKSQALHLHRNVALWLHFLTHEYDDAIRSTSRKDRYYRCTFDCEQRKPFIEVCTRMKIFQVCVYKDKKHINMSRFFID